MQDEIYNVIYAVSDTNAERKSNWKLYNILGVQPIFLAFFLEKKL